jgi:hypothetical protein
VLGLGRLLAIDQRPNAPEELLADDPRNQAAEKAQGQEQDLHHRDAWNPQRILTCLARLDERLACVLVTPRGFAVNAGVPRGAVDLALRG